jgi:proteic killer suppression protein
VIRGFRHRGLRQLHNGDASRISAELRAKAERILDLLNVATGPRDLDLPGLCLHALKGDLDGWWAVNVSENWRIVFRFEDGNALDVDLIDYH